MSREAANNVDDSGLQQDKTKSRYRILVVDDQDGTDEELHAALPAETYEVIGVCHAAEVPEHFKESVPDVVVLDIYMPDEGKLDAGYRIAWQIRERLQLPKMRDRLKMLEVPIVAYSNYAYWIDNAENAEEKGQREQEYARVRRKLRTLAVYDFIDKNMTDKGEPDPDSVRRLAVRIERIISSLQGEV